MEGTIRGVSVSHELQLGATYRHYKTKGLYVPLQLIFFGEGGMYYEPVMQVTFTGDGRNENKLCQLALSLRTMQLFMLPHNFDKPSDAAHVLYHSKEHCRYFVRPLSEFVANVEVSRFPKEDGHLSELVSVARFALVP